MTSSVDGRTVLITGGTGSFGSAMVRRLIRSEVAEIRVLSRDEAKQDDMRHELADKRLRFYLGDVRDPGSVEQAVSGVDHIFHAAALKQVPSCEFFPLEAVRTNVGGSANVITAAHRAGVRTVVCLSTDKSVRPINAMGMTKALMEKAAQAFVRQNPDAGLTVCITRYGNVMYSRGSVIPLFVHQLRAGRPLTVTDPTMTRFMMSLADSVDLVEHAFGHGRKGEVLVPKVPACTIRTLVDALGDVFEVEPVMEVIGVRHGEKMAETLATGEELRRSTDMGDYLRIGLDERDLDYTPYVDRGAHDGPPQDDYTSENTHRLDREETAALLRTLPEIQRELGSKVTT